MKLSSMIGMAIATVLWVLALIPISIGAMMSPMMFDSGENARLWTLFGLIALSPVVIVVAVAVAWVFYGFGRNRAAWICMAAPLAWLAAAAAFLTLGL